jgi:hypothetical protein
MGNDQRTNVIVEDAIVQYTGAPFELSYLNLDPERTRVTLIEYTPVVDMGGMVNEAGLPYRVGEYIMSLTYEVKCDICDEFECVCDDAIALSARVVPQTGIDRFLSLPVLLLVGALLVTLCLTVLNIVRNKRVGKSSKILSVLLIISIVSTIGLGVYAVAVEDYEHTEGVVTARLEITPAPLYLTVVLEDKVFDGTPEIRKERVYINGEIYNGDVVEVEYNETALLEIPYAGDGIRVIFDEFTLTGEHDWNYYVYQPDEKGRVVGSGADINGSEEEPAWVIEITPRDIEVIIEFETKVYNRDTDITVASYSFIDLIEGYDRIHIGEETIERSSRLASFRAEDNVQIIYDTLVLLGRDAHSYNLIQPEGKLDIQPAPLTATGIVPDTKVYDSNISAKFDTEKMSLVGIIPQNMNGQDTVRIGGSPTLVYNNPRAGKSIPMSLVGVTLTGANASDYVFVPPTDVRGNITLAVLTADISVQTKEYNRSALSSVTEELPFGNLIGVFGDDEVYVSDWGTVTLDSRDVGTHSATIVDVILSGEHADSYKFAQPELDGEITPRILTIEPVVSRKEYDGSTIIELESYEFGRLMKGDKVNIGNTENAGELDDYDAGDREVTFELVISGPSSSNYILVQPDNQIITVRTRPVYVDVTYQERNVIMGSLQVSFTYELSNILDDDIYEVGLIAPAPGLMYVGRSSDWQRGTHTATPPLFDVEGTRARNYHVSQPEPGTVTINAAEGTFELIGDPWLNETLTYGTGTVRAMNHAGFSMTQMFEAGFMHGWEHQWIADGETIIGATGPFYTIRGNHRTENDKSIMNTQIGLVLISDCGNYVLRQEERTNRVPYDIRVEFDAYPVRRSTDNAVLITDYAEGGSAGNVTGPEFRRQLLGDEVRIYNMLSDGYMDGVGTSRSEIRVDNRVLLQQTVRGADRTDYTVNHDDANDGVITINAGYAHKGISVDVTDFAFGTQICGQEIPGQWYKATIRNIGNTATGPIGISKAGYYPNAFVNGNNEVVDSIAAYNGTAELLVMPNPGNVLITENSADKAVFEPYTFRADILLGSSYVGVVKLPASVTLEHSGSASQWIYLGSERHRHYKDCDYCSYREEYNCEYTGWSISTDNDNRHQRTCEVCYGVDWHAHNWGAWNNWGIGTEDEHHRTRGCSHVGSDDIACTIIDTEDQTHDDDVEGAWGHGNEVSHTRTRHCSDCGRFIRDELQPHNNNIIGTWVHGDATNHTRTRHCDVCNRDMGNEAQAHVWPATWSSHDATIHRRLCTTCNRPQDQAHTWVNYAGGNSAANHRCPTCLREDAHTWPAYGNWTNANAAQHSRTRTCSTVGCNQTQPETANHVFTWTWNASNHWEHCDAVANNTAGAAGRCGVTRNSAAHTMVWTSDAIHHWRVCSHANCTYTDSLAVHVTSGWWNLGDGAHCARSCTTAGCGRHLEYVAHDLSGWIDVHNGVHCVRNCNRCGAQQVAVSGHAWSSWGRISSTHHRRTCSLCSRFEDMLCELSWIYDPTPANRGTQVAGTNGFHIHTYHMCGSCGNRPAHFVNAYCVFNSANICVGSALPPNHNVVARWGGCGITFYYIPDVITHNLRIP